jgi:hypothetical protein
MREFHSQRHIAFEFKQQELDHRKTSAAELNNQIVKLKLEKLDLSAMAGVPLHGT